MLKTNVIVATVVVIILTLILSLIIGLGVCIVLERKWDLLQIIIVGLAALTLCSLTGR